jgi:hypothetical protein
MKTSVVADSPVGDSLAPYAGAVWLTHPCGLYPDSTSSIRATHSDRHLSISKSQIRMTIHPCSRSDRFTVSSRLRFRSIFLSHHAGRRPGRHLEGCPCHQAESRKTATRRYFQAMSGVPKTDVTWHLQPRTPALQRARRKRISSPVSRLRTRAIRWLRWSGESGSVRTRGRFATAFIALTCASATPARTGTGGAHPRRHLPEKQSPSAIHPGSRRSPDSRTQ